MDNTVIALEAWTVRNEMVADHVSYIHVPYFCRPAMNLIPQGSFLSPITQEALQSLKQFPANR